MAHLGRPLTDSSGVVLTPAGVRSAYAVAIATDVLQVALGPFGWAFADEILDVVAMVLVRGSSGSTRCCCPPS